MHFLSMGGRGQYLWPAYGLTLAVIVLNVIWARTLVREAREDLRRRLIMEAADR
jgi:heme exporter protein CcmD